MNYAVHSASAVGFASRSFSSNFPKPSSPTLPTPVRRITINVGGERFETYERTLARYPRSLLGSPERRQEFYDFARNELVFPSRNKEVFNAILFFYQAKILSRPKHVPLEIFFEEVRFFDLAGYSNECQLGGRDDDITQALPENNTLRNRAWNFLEHPRTRYAHAFSKLNLFLVFAWIILLCAQTELAPAMSKSFGTSGQSDAKPEAGHCKNTLEEGCWFIVDTLFVSWFTMDYVVHILCAPRLRRYVFSASGLVDLITILPYYFDLFLKQTGAALSPQTKALTFLRVFRLLKASRYSSSFRILVGSLTSSAHDFPVWLLLMVMHILFFSSILYYVENDEDNPQFSNIPDVMWFTVITMCAIGYGDVVPKTVLGKIVTSVAVVTGIVIVYCLPAPTLKSNFNRLNELHKSRKAEKKRFKASGVDKTVG